MNNQVGKNPIYELNVQCLSILHYSQYENRLLMMIHKCLQKDIKEAIKSQLSDEKLMKFTPAEAAEGIRHREIPLSKLEPRKGHYTRAKLALIHMSKQGICIPYYKQKYLITYGYFERFFDVDFYKRGQKIIVKFSFSTSLLHYYLSNAMGYHKLDLDTYFSFKRNATRQMYRLYYGHFALSRRNMAAITLANLLSQKSDFKCFGDIDKSLIQPAKTEMDSAYYAGKCGFHFDYSVEESNEATTAEDEEQKMQGSLMNKFIFSFYTQEDDHPTGTIKEQLDDRQTRLCFSLKHTWGVNENVANDLSQQLKVWMISELDNMLQKKEWFAKKMRNSKHAIRNEAGYIVNELKKFYDKMNHRKENADKKGEKKDPPAPDNTIFGTE